MCMAILCIFSGEWFTKQAYDDLRKEVDWEHNQPRVEIFRSVVFDNSKNSCCGYLGKSEQDFNNFVTNKRQLELSKVNSPMPNGEIIPIYNADAFQGIDLFRIK